MAQSYYGGFFGNAGALDDLVYRGEPVAIETLPYYGGGMGVTPLAGGNFLRGEGLQIDSEAHKQKNRQQKIYHKGMGTDNPNEKEIFLQRTGAQLPLAAVGNVGGLIAQAAPMYGDTIDMGPMEGDYSNMPVIPDEEQERIDADTLLQQYRDRLFPPSEQPMPFGFDSMYIT
jgi:hypothetical protein